VYSAQELHRNYQELQGNYKELRGITRNYQELQGNYKELPGITGELHRNYKLTLKGTVSHVQRSMWFFMFTDWVYIAHAH
jgi:hypothetical protein